MQHDFIPSETTGKGYRYPNVQAQTMECSATTVRYKPKMNRQGMIAVQRHAE